MSERPLQRFMLSWHLKFCFLFIIKEAFKDWTNNDWENDQIWRYSALVYYVLVFIFNGKVL